MRVHFFNKPKRYSATAKQRLRGGLLMGLALLVGGLCLPLMGGQGARAATQNVTLQPVADTHIQNSNNAANFGSSTTLTGSSSDARALVRWNTAGTIPANATLTSAKLRVYVTNISVTAPGMAVHQASNTWAENTLTWNNQPAWNSTVIATSAAAQTGQWLEVTLPVSSVKLAEATSYGIRYSASGSNFRFASREYSATQQPQLVLTYEEAVVEEPPVEEPATPVAGSQTVNPSQDSFARASASTTNFGTATELDASSSDNRAYLKFATSTTVPTGSEVKSVKLRVYTTRIAVTTGGYEVHPTTDGWTEGGLTWANQPTWNTQVLATSTAPTLNTWIDITLPVSSVNLSGNTNLAVRYTASGSLSRFASREAVNKPQLIINYEQPAPTEPVSGVHNVVTTEDTLARASESTTNFGTATELDASSSDNRAYLRFPTNVTIPTGSEVKSAKLRVYTTRIAITTGGYEIHPTTNDWAENALTWANQPAWSTEVLATSSAPQLNQWIDITLPVNSLNLSGNTNLAMRYTDSGSLARIASRESTNKPQLLIEYGPVETQPQPTYPTIMAAGDAVCRPGMNPTSTTCQHAAVANLITANNPTAVAALGDLQYDTGTYTEFMGAYDLSWGQFKNKTYPTPGNHEYNDVAGNAKGYYDYFNGVDVQTGRAGDRNKGYYSYNLGDWHVVVLNSECWDIPNDGCGVNSPQYQWLQQDLAANNAVCTLAYWHQPRFTSGGGYTGNTDLGAMWNLMVGDVDAILTGHTHSVEIFKKIGVTPVDSKIPVLSPTGIKQFIVGNGGRSLYPFNAGTPVMASDGTVAVEARNNTVFGALHMTLKPTGYDWKMMGINGQTFTHYDSQTTGAFNGSETCN